ncbi:hypothetical protein NC652_012106 [Populus alba x Populus x berolinensis]|nr:hypothetical protein NC652_012080 [Populus alba x Populus x berolinensis]KAJ6937687.1 hypothetical protein NC652_012097 [Populus alba x Populus x berolinensis]KAJ6937697.1 hypothetical protein NC652_012106 [Populus alba x Populus x berolinensis]
MKRTSDYFQYFKSGIESCFEQLSVEGFFERCSKEKQDYNNCFELIINGWNVVPLIQKDFTSFNLISLV